MKNQLYNVPLLFLLYYAMLHIEVKTKMSQVRGERIIKRDLYLNKIIKNMWNGDIKIITEIRRCEKLVLFGFCIHL